MRSADRFIAWLTNNQNAQEPAPERESPLRRGAEMLRLIEALARQRAHAEMRLKARYGRAFSKPSPAPAERAFEQLFIDRGRQAACLEIESELGITKPVQQRVYELRMGKTGNPREDSYFD
jgi:hypothetical protein